MAQQFDYPKTETELRALLDELYRQSREAREKGGYPAFKGLLEIMSAETTIVTAIHNIKSNHGSDTPGVDNKTMRRDYLQKPYRWVINDIQKAFDKFEAQKIRRKYIDKPGKKEKRPLGIPTIRDRIVQECMRIVLEPIVEAQFFDHSYGFRPMRDTAMALERLNFITFHTGYHWFVEGDISKCFDHINHKVLLRRLYHLGIRDQRVLQIINHMLKAGVLDVCEVNEEGTMQGGIISPLLANVYLDIMDEWITKQWELKNTSHKYNQDSAKRRALKKTSLVPAFLVRYADDFVIVTDSREHAMFWKDSLSRFLETKMMLTLSKEKTLITDVRKKHATFLGYEFKQVVGKGEHGYVTRTQPDRERLKRKVDAITYEIKNIPRNTSKEEMIVRINRINSSIRGVIQYYQCCTWVSVSMDKFGRKITMAANHRLKQYKGKWIKANETVNLPRVHQKYRQKIPAIKYRDLYIGITSLTFCTWSASYGKNPKETPYSEEGREINFKRTKKRRIQARLDDVYSDNSSIAVIKGKWGRLNNFEFFMNKAYALNRDKLKCRVCNKWMINLTPYTHRINPNLPLDRVNRVNNLISVHKHCCEAIINPSLDISRFNVNAQKKILIYRDKLVVSHACNN